MRVSTKLLLVIGIIDFHQLGGFFRDIQGWNTSQFDIDNVLNLLFGEINFFVFSFLWLHSQYYQSFCCSPYKVYSKLSVIYVIMSAYSIGKQEKRASFVPNNNVPGVGAYSSDETHTSKVVRGPTFVIGKSARIKTDKSVGPGPNIYNLNRTSGFFDKSKGYHISGRIRQRIKSEGPGPACYSVSKLSSTKHYYIGIRQKMLKPSTEGPGPGDYEIQKVKNSHAISFEQSKRPSLENSARAHNPGPADYHNDVLMETKNKFVFPKRSKFFEEQQQNKEKKIIPGPCSYTNININAVKKQITAAKFAKSKRNFVQGDPNLPGPGSYSPTSQKRTPVATIGNSPKALQQNNINPGPAAYNILQSDLIRKKQPTVVFGKTQRGQLNFSKDIKAGPGSYNIDYHERGHAYSITGRRSMEKVFKSPDPVSYSPKYQSQFRKTEMGRIGKQRKFLQLKQQIPGPGTYRIEESAKKSKTFYFPKQSRKWNTNDNPGPGSYQIKPIIGSASQQSKI